MSETSVKILGGYAVAQFAALGQTSGDSLLSAFSESNTQHLLTTVEEQINCWKVYTHTFRAKSPDYVDKLLQPVLSSGSPPIISVRFGLTASDKSVWRAWEDHVIISHRITLNPDPTSGPFVTIKTADRLWLLHTNKRVKAYHGTMSSIVSQMWKDAGGKESFIETTALDGHNDNTGFWYQAFESDWSFLMRSVLPLSRNKNGSSSYRIFVKDNVLHFHTSGYGVSTVKSIAYTSGAPGFDNLTIEDRYIEMAGGAGASGLRRAVYDPSTGNTDIAESDSSSLIKFASSRPKYVNDDYRISHIGSNLASAETARNQQQFSALSSEAYGTTLTSERCMDIVLSDVIALSLSTNITESASYSGEWLVNKVTHEIKEGTLKSRYVVNRGELVTALEKDVVGVNDFENSSVPGIDFKTTGESQAISQNSVASKDTVTVPIQNV
jgi:hypothetical protein